jgi:hypothetical protein
MEMTFDSNCLFLFAGLDNYHTNNFIRKQARKESKTILRHSGIVRQAVNKPTKLFFFVLSVLVSANGIKGKM